MDRADECVCCQEIPEMLHLNEEVMTIKKLKEPLTCITDNPAFASVCLITLYLEQHGISTSSSMTTHLKVLSIKETDMLLIGNLHD